MFALAGLLGVVFAQGPSIALNGIVTEASGAPVGGAEVLLVGPPVPEGAPFTARARTDDQGRFTIERPGALAGLDRYRAVRLWATHPGHRVGWLSFAGALPAADEPVRLVLEPPSRAEFHVEGPDGAPVAGARVRVTLLAPAFIGVPPEIGARTAATTDADGRAEIEAFGPTRIFAAEVEAEGFGTQPRFFDPPTPGRKRIALRAAAPLEGRFAAQDGRPLRGWRITASTTPDDEPNSRGGYAGRAVVDVAEDGRFHVPAIATGALDLDAEWPGEIDVLPVWPKSMAVRADRENRVEIPVRTAAEVVGRIVERDTGVPVPGVRLYLFRPGESSGANAITDADGRFVFHSLAGKARLGISDVLPAHVNAPGAFRDEFEVPEAPGRVEVPAVALRRAAPPLHGSVVDEARRPVAGAAVSAAWSYTEDGAAIAGASNATTDAGGHFTMGGLPPEIAVSITARGEGRATAEAVRARTGQTEAVALTVVTTAAVVAVGRVLGPGGTPVESAAVKLLGQTRGANGQLENFREVTFDAGRYVYTGPDGVYRTPKELDRAGAEYRAEVAADGLLPAQTPWVAVGDADELRLPDVTLRRKAGLRVVVGRVVDRDETPIAGARVLQRGDGPHPTEATTDEAGRFRLPGVYGGRALVFAEAPGFRFGGAIVGPDGPAEIRLLRVTDRPPVPARAAEPMARDEERALARRLLEPVLAEGQTGALGQAGGDATLALARVDPGRILAMVEERVLPNVQAHLAQAALGQFEDDPQAAIATIEADRDPHARARGFLALADFAADVAPKRRGALLDRALAEARRVPDAKIKIYLFGEVADRWLETFDLEHATPILREGKALLDTLGAEVYPYEVAPFGATLAALDPAAAETFLERKAPGGSNEASTVAEANGMAAVRAADKDPAEAERLARQLKVVPNFYNPEIYLLRVARNMARLDLPRARAILDLLDDPERNPNPGQGPLRPYGLALLATARDELDPDGARALLDEAFDGLRRIVEARPGQPTYPSVPNIMAGLLPLVERLEPEREPERLWLALALRPSRPEQVEPSEVGNLATLAMLVSRHDRALAAVIFEPVAGRLPELAVEPYGGQLFNYGNNPLRIVAAYDPRALLAFIEQLPEAARVTTRTQDGWVQVSLDVQARLAAAAMLGMPSEARRRSALRGPFGVWPVEGNPRYRRQF